MTRDWNAHSYSDVATVMKPIAKRVLDRLSLRGDEVVLDAGCGTGMITADLIKLLPNGRVIAVDGSISMVISAKKNLGAKAEVLHADLLDLTLEKQVDIVFSTATFHWIDDHKKLFTRFYNLLKPGGQIVAQCGGEGNGGKLPDIIKNVSSQEVFAQYFNNWSGPWYFASPEKTEFLLKKLGFKNVKCWLTAEPAVTDKPADYLETIWLGSHLERLPFELRKKYVKAVANNFSAPMTINYIRLNIEATRP